MWDQQQTSGPDERPVTRLEQLRKQERVWFNWVCRLHDVHAGTQTPQSAAILSIARRRWADARRALDRAGGWLPPSRDSAGAGESPPPSD
jgi:hypothetical protein